MLMQIIDRISASPHALPSQINIILHALPHDFNQRIFSRIIQQTDLLMLRKELTIFIQTCSFQRIDCGAPWISKGER
jgi:hypothetical protein